MTPELAIAAGIAALACAFLGLLGARWISNRPSRPRPGFSWAIVPLAVVVGTGVGYGVGVAGGTEVAATATGAAVGVALGVVALLVWRRTHPRVRGAGAAYTLTGIPTSALDDLTDEAAAGLLLRWLSLSAGPLVRVAIVPASPGLAQLANDAGAWLHSLQAGLQGPQREMAGGHRTDGPASHPEALRETVPAGVNGGQDPSASPRPQWRSRWSPKGPRPSQGASAGGGPDETRASEPAPRLVMLTTGLADPDLLHEDLVVMLAEDGMMSHELSDRADRLERLGRRPDWMLLVRAPRAVQKRLAPRGKNGAGPAGSRKS